MKRSIKLISYNIWHGVYLNPLVEFLDREQPDILCVQEVGTSGLGQKKDTTNLHEVIQKKLDMQAHYEHMYSADEGEGEYTIGVAIYSKYPILETTVLRYERETSETLRISDVDRYHVPRVLLGCLLDVEPIPLWVFTTHFTISPDAKVTQHQVDNAQKVATFLNKFPEYILCGDLNTPHGSQIFDILKSDAFDVVGPGHPTLHPTLHRVGHLGLQVDHAFIKSQRVNVDSVSLPLADGSDHVPLVIEFTLE
jgi:endonuclease/exonuclease/phosphatase family metal-dependent hydrolase